MMLNNQVLGPWILVELVPPHCGRYLSSEPLNPDFQQYQQLSISHATFKCLILANSLAYSLTGT